MTTSYYIQSYRELFNPRCEAISVSFFVASFVAQLAV